MAKKIQRLEPITFETISVIMPVYNEVDTVEEIVRRVLKVELPLTLDLVIVDDGSTDGTAELLSAMQGDGVQVIVHEKNQGKGAALRTGLGVAKGDVLVIQDADLEYDPDDWPKLLDPLLKRKASVVYGSRFTGERMNMLPSHWVGNRILSLVTNVLYRSTLSDMETCYKVFDRRVIEGIRIVSDRFDFEPEITAKVLRRGFHIYEVPISYSGREFEEGKKITWVDGLGALKALIKFRFTRKV